MAAVAQRGIEPGINGVIGFLLRTTGLTPLPAVPQHLQMFAHSVTPIRAEGLSRDPSAAVSTFTFSEARRRVQEFLSDSPVGDLVSYFQSRMLRPTKRSIGTAAPTTVLQDRISGERRPTRGVSPKLTTEAMSRAAARDAVQDDARMGLVRALNRTNASVNDFKGDYQSFGSWINAATVRMPVKKVFGVNVDWKPGAGDVATISVPGGSNTVKIGLGRAHLVLPDDKGVQRSVIGLRVLTCGADPAKNKALIAAKRMEIAKGLGIPEERVKLMHLPGYPQFSHVIMGDANMVLTEKVNRAWNVDTLKEMNDGVGFLAALKNRAAQRLSAPGIQTLSAVEQIREASRGAALPAFGSLDPEMIERGPGAASAIIMVHERSMEVINRATGNNVAIRSFADLMPGNYRIHAEGEDAPGSQVGMLQVDERGATQMIYVRPGGGDAVLREHSFLASKPSFMPVTGNDAPQRFAHEGKIMPKAELIDHRRALSEGYSSADEYAAARARAATQDREVARREGRKPPVPSDAFGGLMMEDAPAAPGMH